MFQITEYTEARLATLTNRIEKHGDDEKPAVSLGLEIVVANTILDTIDPALRLALFKPKDPSEPELPGVEQSTPVLRCNTVDRVILTTKHEGWTLSVDDGIDDTQPVNFGGCKVDKVTSEPHQGGSTTLRCRIGTSDLDAERSGMLSMHVGQSIWIKLLPPEKKADTGTDATGAEIDGTTEAFRRDHPDATDLFVAGAADPDGDDEDDEGTDGEGSDAEEEPAAQPAPQRTARGGVRRGAH